MKNIFEKKITAMILASTCSIAWACAFPFIKLGTKAFQIGSNDIGSKTLFAGIRFFAAGIIVLVIAKAMKRSFEVKRTSDKLLILLFGLVNTSLHYFFFYVGLSVQSGSRSAIIEALSSFLLIILACICFKSEKMTVRKVLGCILGFSGIVMVNIGSGDVLSEFTFMGDGMLLLSAVFSAIGGVLTRVVTRRTDPIIATGASLAFGGGLLVVAGLLSGGHFSTFNLEGLFYLVLLIVISVYGFVVYNQLLCYNSVGDIAIFNALIPILGVVLSCIFLGEPFMPKYIFAGIVVALGVFVINYTENGESKRNKSKER